MNNSSSGLMSGAYSPMDVAPSGTVVMSVKYGSTVFDELHDVMINMAMTAMMSEQCFISCLRCFSQDIPIQKLNVVLIFLFYLWSKNQVSRGGVGFWFWALA